MKFLLPIVFLFGVCFVVFPQNSGLPISIETRTSSNNGNSLSELIIIPYWSDEVSSELALRMLSNSEIGAALSNDPKSLLATEYKRWEAELLLMRRTISLGGNTSFNTAAGLEWWNEDELERGYFAFGGDAQLMANQTKINYFLPVISGGFETRFGSFQLSDSCSYSPFFYYMLDQTVAIQPLVAGQYSQAVDGLGKTLLSNELRASFFNIFNISWYFDLTLLDFPFLRLGSNEGVATFYPDTNSSKSINHTVMAGLSLPIGDAIRLLIQVGKNFSKAVDLEQDTEIESQSFVWEASLSLR